MLMGEGKQKCSSIAGAIVDWSGLLESDYIIDGETPFFF